jgi:hypothetical protein
MKYGDLVSVQGMAGKMAALPLLRFDDESVSTRQGMQMETIDFVSFFRT